MLRGSVSSILCNRREVGNDEQHDRCLCDRCYGRAVSSKTHRRKAKHNTAQQQQRHGQHTKQKQHGETRKKLQCNFIHIFSQYNTYVGIIIIIIIVIIVCELNWAVFLSLGLKPCQCNYHAHMNDIMYVVDVDGRCCAAVHFVRMHSIIADVVRSVRFALTFAERLANGISPNRHDFIELVTRSFDSVYLHTELVFLFVSAPFLPTLQAANVIIVTPTRMRTQHRD